MYLLSEKLQAYITKVEKETGRQTLIQTTSDLGLSGMKARFSEHPTLIHVLIAPDLQQGEQMEQAIAHEVTHGLLEYAKGYCQITPSRSLTKLEEHSIGILGTMIEDIVVNKIIQENGFSPYSPTYLETVKKETNAARQRKDHYQEFQDPLFKDRFMVFRYILAWGFLKYYELDEPSRKILVRFENDFKYSFPRQYKIASQIKEIILQNDIFSAEGYCQAIIKALKLWDLDKLVIVKS